MSAFQRFVFGEVAGVRAFLLERVALVLIAFDAWVLMVPHAGRYGAGGFNVAHFGVLDRLQPVPTPGLYVAVMLLVGGVALVLALTGGPRWLKLGLFGLYTYGWMMSRLDSYQHHYFLSLVLLLLVFFPDPTAPTPGGRTQAWALCVLALNIALVYAWTAVTKADPAWHEGDTLARLAGKSAWGEAVRSGLLALGLTEAAAWRLLARGTLFIQIVVAAAYALAPLRDRTRSRALGILYLAGLTLAALFHVGAEFMGLQIGWFSYYMIALAAIYFLPAGALEVVRTAIVAPFVRLSASPAGRILFGAGRAGTLAIAGVAAGTALFAGAYLGLPGALGAGALAALALGLAGAWEGRAAVRPVLAAGAVASLALVVCTALLPVRFDYYRWRGGDLRRRGDLAAALEAYRKAERYAPEGKSRQSKIDAVEAELERRGQMRP